MTQAQVVREFAADPASVALLLSGPTAEVLWPPTDAPADDIDAASPRALRLGPPMRSGVGFVVDLTIADSSVGPARGRLALTPASAGSPVAGTCARLLLTAAHAPASELHRRGEDFLSALGSLAVARSSAA